MVLFAENDSKLDLFLNFKLILYYRGGRHVAVKIVKNVDRYCEAARSEIQVLEHLNTTDPNSTL